MYIQWLSEIQNKKTDNIYLKSVSILIFVLKYRKVTSMYCWLIFQRVLFWQKGHNMKIIVDKFHAAKTLRQIKLSQTQDSSDEAQWIKLNINLINIHTLQWHRLLWTQYTDIISPLHKLHWLPICFRMPIWHRTSLTEGLPISHGFCLAGTC